MPQRISLEGHERVGGERSSAQLPLFCCHPSLPAGRSPVYMLRGIMELGKVCMQLTVSQSRSQQRIILRCIQYAVGGVAFWAGSISPPKRAVPTFVGRPPDGQPWIRLKFALHSSIRTIATPDHAIDPRSATMRRNLRALIPERVLPCPACAGHSCHERLHTILLRDSLPAALA